MSDLSRLKELFDEWEVPYEEEDSDVILKAGFSNDGKVIGYTDFVTHFTFDEDGKFRRIGIWE